MPTDRIFSYFENIIYLFSLLITPYSNLLLTNLFYVMKALIFLRFHNVKKTSFAFILPVNNVEYDVEVLL